MTSKGAIAELGPIKVTLRLIPVKSLDGPAEPAYQGGINEISEALVTPRFTVT
jgi:hypothetical protein